MSHFIHQYKKKSPLALLFRSWAKATFHGDPTMEVGTYKMTLETSFPVFPKTSSTIKFTM